MGSRYPGMRPRRTVADGLTLDEQRRRVQRAFPRFGVERRNGALVIRGTVQPTVLNNTYVVRIVYAPGDVPKAYVESPPLRSRGDGAPIPHVYASDEGPRPCLYLPGSGEWTNRKSLATTVIPWLILWLYYYELWLATGEWLGGGAHPSPQPTPAPSLSGNAKGETSAAHREQLHSITTEN
jgi:hypothetical protein